MVIYHNRAERFDAIIHNVHTYLQDYFHDLNQTIQACSRWSINPVKTLPQA